MSPAWLWAAGAACLAGTLLLAWRLRAAESPGIHIRTFLVLLALAAIGLPVAALYQVRDTLSLAQQIAAATGVVVAPLLLSLAAARPDDPPADSWSRTWQFLCAVYFGWMAFDLLRPQDQYSNIGIFALMSVYAFAAGLWSLATKWRDEDALAEDFGGGEGYRPVRSFFPTRARAVLNTSMLGAMLLGLLALYLTGMPA